MTRHCRVTKIFQYFWSISQLFQNVYQIIAQTLSFGTIFRDLPFQEEKMCVQKCLRPVHFQDYFTLIPNLVLFFKGLEMQRPCNQALKVENFSAISRILYVYVVCSFSLKINFENYANIMM